MKQSIDPEAEDKEAGGETAKEPNVTYLCMKYNRRQQGNKLVCRDPELYCKYRTSCLIHYMEKQDRKR